MWSRLHVRWGNPPHVTSPTWGPPPSCKQALMATSPQQPPLYNCHLFLSRGTVHILTLVRTSLQQQRPLQRVPKCQNNLSTTANFFNDWRKSQKFNPYGALMINLGNSNLIVFHLYWLSKHKLCMILIANIAILAHFLMLTIRFKTLFKFFRVLIAPAGISPRRRNPEEAL